MYKFDPLVMAYDSIGVIGTSTSIGVSTRVRRLELSAQEEQLNCVIHDLGKFQGSVPALDIQFYVVMSPAGSEVPKLVLDVLNDTGKPFSIENIKDNPSFSPAHEEYLRLEQDLLIELEKLLPADNPVRVQRETYRAQVIESVQMPEVRSIVVDGVIQEIQ